MSFGAVEGCRSEWKTVFLIAPRAIDDYVPEDG